MDAKPIQTGGFPDDRKMCVCRQKRRRVCAPARSVILASKTVEAPATTGIWHVTDSFTGQRGKLSMAIAQWTPHVQCSISRSVPEVTSACRVALDRMPTSDHQEVFGERGEANIDVPLPVRYRDRQYIPYCPFCVLLIC